MLSYLKDENKLPASSDMPDGAEGTNQQDYITVSGQDQKVKQGTIVLAVLFAAGGLGIWFMVKQTTPATANAEATQEQTQLDSALAQLNQMKSEMDAQMNSVAGRFNHFSNVNQVAVDELKKNPFKREISYANENDGPNEGDLQAERLQQEAQILSMSMELWTITATPKGDCCMINDKVLYVGDTYNEMTVTDIGQKNVMLSYKGIPVELKMD